MAWEVGFVGAPDGALRPHVKVVPVTQGDVLHHQAGRPPGHRAYVHGEPKLVRLADSTMMGLRVAAAEKPQAVLCNASLTTILFRIRHPRLPIIF